MSATIVHTDMHTCDFGLCEEPADVATTLCWKSGPLQGTLEIRTMCERHAALTKNEVWKGSREATFTVHHAVVRCTSDDPTNHQGDTCPVHEM